MTYLGYLKRANIKGFGSENAAKTTFRNDPLRKVAVEEYFPKGRSSEITYFPSLTFFHRMTVVNIGSGDNDVFVPSELCKIERSSLLTGDLTCHKNAALCCADCTTPVGDAQTITIRSVSGFEASSGP